MIGNEGLVRQLVSCQSICPIQWRLSINFDVKDEDDKSVAIISFCRVGRRFGCRSFCVVGLCRADCTCCAERGTTIHRDSESGSNRLWLPKRLRLRSSSARLHWVRITNETSYGRSLLRDSQGDPLGKQVTDLMSKALTESGDALCLSARMWGVFTSRRALDGKQIEFDRCRQRSLWGRSRNSGAKRSEKPVLFRQASVRLLLPKGGYSCCRRQDRPGVLRHQVLVSHQRRPLRHSDSALRLLTMER